MPTQVYSKNEEETKVRNLMEAIGDPKIPILGRSRYQTS